MMSAFNDPQFASFWNSVSGTRGQTYKQYVVDPLMFKLMGRLKNKIVLDLGCGNGYLGSRFVKEGAKEVTLMDISSHNLEYAKKLNSSPKVIYLRHDATKTWTLRSHSVDVIFSDMLLNEIKNISRPIKEAFRVIKKGGQFIFAVTHPAWDLFEFALASAGHSRNILSKTKPYFFRGLSKFIMGTESLKPRQGKEYPKSFEVEHYHRPMEDYFSALLSTGFSIAAVREPALPKIVLKKFPGYREMVQHPISLVIQSFRK